MKKETAVEWLFDNLNKCFDKFDNGEYGYTDFVNESKEVRKQAKAMEKEQIIEAHGIKTYRTTQQGVDVYEIKNAQDYYNETYEKRNRN